jgi:hypothetical protein
MDICTWIISFLASCMHPRVKKWLVRPLIIITSLLCTLVVIGFIVLSTQQERLVNLAVGELNKQFKGEITIERSTIALFKNFPYVSVALHNTRFYADKTKKENPIATVDKLYAGFSLRDILKQKYDIKQLFLQGGNVELIREKDGTVNLIEAQHAPGTVVVSENGRDHPSTASIHLEKIVVKELRISLLDKASGSRFKTDINGLTSSFTMDSTRLSLTLNSNLKLDVITGTDTALFRDKELQLALTAAYLLDSKRFEFSNCTVKLQEADFNVTGYANLSDTTYVNFRVKGEKNDFNLFTAFLPGNVKEILKPFQYNGKLYFDALIKGNATNDRLPLIQASFGCREAWFINTTANKKVDQLGFQGYYTNGEAHNLKTSELRILNVTARPEKGIFKGHFAVRDFTNPKAIVQMNSQLELNFLGEFLGIHDLKQMTGTIKLDIDFKEVHDIPLPEASLQKLKEGVQSRLVVENLSFRIPGYPHAVKDMNIHAEMKNGRVVVDSASLKIGMSDLNFSGSISDVRRFLRDRDKSIKLSLQAGSKQLVLSDLLSYDTALARKWNEEIHGFNISLALQTTVQQLIHPSPLPKGTFEVKNLRGSFKNYAHTVNDIGATVLINDTLLRLSDFTGMIDSSDINFKGRVTNYQLWFADIKKGKTQIAFDFKSNRFAVRDVFSRAIRQYLPRGYRREQLNNVWLRSKIDLTYDTNFRFAKAKVANVSAELKGHKLKLHSISGGVKYGAKILSFDTLRGKIGNSDFDISLKYYFKGIDRYNNKVANSLKFSSVLLDVDEMSQYDLAPKTGTVKRDSTGKFVALIPDSTKHAQAFNIFMIPFSDFNAQINIGKLKYNKLWLKEVNAKLTMLKDQTLSVDTLSMKVAGGAIVMRGKFNGSDPNKIFFRSWINFDQVDLEKMLLKLDHFGQDVVINKNVKGKLSGQIKSYVQVHPDLVPILSNTKAELSLNIYQGTLVDFAPMQAMAGYFKDKNLRLIHFDTLSNKLTFSNGILDIPAMDINSSLGYIRISGKQSVDLSMEYYVRVPLKMVTKVGFSALFNGKPEEVDVNQVDEIEYIDKDKKIAFMNLKITGTPAGAYDVSLGKPKKKRGA